MSQYKHKLSVASPNTHNLCSYEEVIISLSWCTSKQQLYETESRRKPNHYTYFNLEFYNCKKRHFSLKNYDIFLIFAKSIDCGYTPGTVHVIETPS